jgi:hypothetical protein
MKKPPNLFSLRGLSFEDQLLTRCRFSIAYVDEDAYVMLPEGMSIEEYDQFVRYAEELISDE